MTDSIDAAIQAVNQKPSRPIDPLDSAMEAVNPAQKIATNKLVDATSKATAAKDGALSKLPQTKDPELIKKEKEAEVQEKAVQAKEGILKKKSEALNVAKNLAIGLASSKLGKVGSAAGTAQSAVAAGTAILGLLRKKKPAAQQTQDMVKADQKTKEIEQERVQTSRESHQKNVESFTYPLKPIEVTPTPPEPPEIPIQSPVPPAPTPTPSPSPQPRGDFYILYKSTFGQYENFRAYYKGQLLYTAQDQRFNEGRPDLEQRLEGVNKLYSYQVCQLAASILRGSEPRTGDWVDNSQIRDGCPATLNNGSGGFSIGRSNMFLE